MSPIHRVFPVAALGCVLASIAVLSQTAPLPAADRRDAPADLIVVHGKVYPGDGRPFQQALAVRGPRIVAVGSDAEIEKLKGPASQTIDAGGAAVVAGFNDIHAHMLSGGLDLDNVDLQGVQRLDELQSRIRAYAAQHADKTWVRGRGWGYGPFGADLPTRQQLDAVIPDRPAVMRCFDGHSIWVNSKALEAAGITKNTPDPPNGVIVRDPATGEPTGLLKESPASALVNKVMPKPSRAEQRQALEAAITEALRFGVTSVTDAAGSPEDLEVYDELRRSGELSARVHYSLLVTPGFTDADADRFDAVWRAHPDTPVLKSGLIKMFMDGVIETNTAFMLAPYANNPATRGTPNYTPQEFDRIVRTLDRRGWQIMVHGLGDGAVRMVLDGFEHAAAANPAPSRGRRHRVEHIETIDLADVPRFGTLGVIASMHPGGGFIPVNPPQQAATPGFMLGAWGRNIGPERAARGGMWKSITDAGGRVVFGSDWPVASLDAMSRITSIVHRPPRPGGTDQRLSMTTAIDDYTSAAAYASFDEKEKGVLAPGMLADIAILATDVFGTPPAKRADVAVKTTIFNGKVVYRAAAQ
jgi:predicted amidohydrolase YtcJ